MLLYADPATAPQKHPSVALEKSQQTTQRQDERKDRQLQLWDDTASEENTNGISPK
jgi:hypothetical protein